VKLHNTKYSLSGGHFEVDSFPREFAAMDGLALLPVIMDFTVGQEVALYWLDRTPFVHELAAIRPFQFFLRSGLFRSSFGPLMWMLFYVPNPAAESSQPFASVECHLNPSEPPQVSLWRRLAHQTHWHLTLLGAGDEVADFFELDNHYGLADALDTMEDACRGMHVTDFMRAKQEFSDRYSMDDLYAMS
jgi:hypothetical protein